MPPYGRISPTTMVLDERGIDSLYGQYPHLGEDAIPSSQPGESRQLPTTRNTNAKSLYSTHHHECNDNSTTRSSRSAPTVNLYHEIFGKKTRRQHDNHEKTRSVVGDSKLAVPPVRTVAFTSWQDQDELHNLNSSINYVDTGRIEKNPAMSLETKLSKDGKKKKNKACVGTVKGGGSDDEPNNPYRLPPAFQVISKKSSKKSKKVSKSDIDAPITIQEIRGSMTKKAAKTGRARSKDLKTDKYDESDDNSDQSRERNSSLGRLRKGREEKKTKSSDDERADKELLNSLSPTDYSDRCKSRDNPIHDDDSSDTACVASRSRSRSLGALEKKTKKKKHRNDKANRSASADEHQEEIFHSLPITEERFNSVKKQKERDREQSFDRSEHSRMNGQFSQDDTRSVVSKSNLKSRSNSVGRRHKTRKSPSIQENDNSPYQVPTLFAAALTPSSKRKSKTEIKPASSSMDGIFGSLEAVKQTKKSIVTPTPINAIHGNRSALAAWKIRETSKNNESDHGVQIEVPSKEIVPVASENDLDPSPCTRRFGVSCRRPLNSTRETHEAALPPAFQLASMRRERAATLQNPRGTQTTDGHYIGRDERQKIRDEIAFQRRSVEVSMAKFGLQN
jgi:hypothetical protein